jgi:hypothetical protein
MQFLNPAGFWLSALLAPIILLYILKVRLRKETVSTHMFWARVFEERRTRSLWRKLRHLVSLLLQLLFLALLTSALIDPFLSSSARSVRTVVIVDCSASMNCRDGGSDSATRWETATTEVRRLLAGMRQSEQAAIIAAEDRPRVVVGFTDHLGTLRQGVDEIRPMDAPTRITEAVELAQRLFSEEEETKILIFSDGCFVDAETIASEEGVVLRQVGKPQDNVGITKFQARRSLVDSLGYEIFIEVSNFTEEEVSLRLRLELNGIALDVVPITIASGEAWSDVLRNTTEGGGRLLAEIDRADAFECDNQAEALLPECPPLKVLLCGESDFFLEQVLLSLPNCNVSRMNEIPERVPDDAVLFLHRDVPATIPEGRVFVIDPQSDSDLWTVGPPLDNPIVTEQAVGSTLMTHVHLNNVLMPGARSIVPTEQLTRTPTVLASSMSGSPLYFMISENDRDILILTTDLDRSDLPLRTAFPIMVASAMTQFRGQAGRLDRAYATGELIRMSYEPTSESVKSLILCDPSGGEVRELPLVNGLVAVGALNQQGIWTLRENNGWDAGPDIACNLNSSTESDLRSAPDGIESETAKATLGGAGRPIWFWIILTAIALSITEWGLYQRRWIS